MVHEVLITVDRVKGTCAVSGSAVFIRNEQIEITLENVGLADINAGLVFEVHHRGITLAKATQWATDGDGNAVGNLNTNTVQLVNFFARSPSHCQKMVGIKAYTTAQLQTVFAGMMIVHNFTSEEPGEPALLLSPAEVLLELNNEIELLQSAIVELREEYQQYVLGETTDMANNIRAAFQAADVVVGHTAAQNLENHGEDPDTHQDIRNMIRFVGEAIFIQCLPDNKWRKVVASEPNEFGEYMLMIQQEPTYVWDDTEKEWVEE